MRRPTWRMVTWTVVAALAVLAWAGAAQAAELQWWCHWAIEDNKKVVLFEAKKRFEAKNPGNTVTITFYEKKNMFPTLRAAFTAGSGFPDVFYYESDVPEFIPAGWLADLSTGIRWENIEPSAKAFWTRPGPGGKMGPGRSRSSPRPTSCTTTRRCSSSSGSRCRPTGRSPRTSSRTWWASASSRVSRPSPPGRATVSIPALYIPSMLLLDQARRRRRQEAGEGRAVLEGSPGGRGVPTTTGSWSIWGRTPRRMTSMTLAESHRYFHTEQKACMFPVGSWYTGRAFVPQEKGGQPKDFELGLLNYPLMKDGKGAGQKYIGYGGSLARRRQGPQPGAGRWRWSTRSPIVEIGNLWMGKTGIQTGHQDRRAPRSTARSSGTSTSSPSVNKNTKWEDIAAQNFKLI